ncbi:MAG: hypothetical protein A2284_19425 [Deltaproteobacteria bacterium RIFOXYA12_FULL_61_11]|nr:MAG: hypothetical protein A2284_19425 [Deltaproteobacteria bacterium RIFOXYA12_FULL_61_11]
MKVALTVWDGRISPVFDVCREVLVLELEEQVERGRSLLSFEGSNPQRTIERLIELGITTLVCGAISEPLLQELRNKEVQVIAFVAGELEQVLHALLHEQLPAPAFSMPGCWRRQCGCRRNSGRGARFRMGRAVGGTPAKSKSTS